MRRLRVLVSAYACEPGKGSEPGVGWNWVRQIARFHDVWVITRANNRRGIEKVLGEDALPNVRWIYVDLPRWATLWKRGQRGQHLYYYLWQMEAYFTGRRLQSLIDPDIVHHVTFVTYWMPSFLALLRVPFVWGPVGGGESAPKAFWRQLSARGKAYEVARCAARRLGESDPFVRSTARRARVGFSTTSETAERVRHLGCRCVRVLTQVALPQEEIDALAATALRRSGPFRLVSVGRLLHWKGFHLGLEAFARMRRSHPTSEYWILGDGPEGHNLKLLAAKLGVDDNVRFWGSVPRNLVWERLAECDVLVHPSLHDSGGGVCIEAMAAGLPVICLDLGGPAVQVTEETGFRIPAIHPRQAVDEMAEAMARLAGDEGARVAMGERGRVRTRDHFTWEGKGDLITRVYEELV